MKELISNFPAQLTEAIQIGKSAVLNINKKKYNKVVLCGLGGSGIGGSIVKDYCDNLLSIPFLVRKNYFIPQCVDADTLFIACSYSGDTEETLQAVQTAKKRKATIVCITSGGQLEKFASKNNFPCIKVPGGMPPRSCLGYSLVQILFILNKASLIKNSFEKEIHAGLDLIKKESKNIHKQAQQIAQKIHQKHIAIYTISGYEGLIIRSKQQLNENAKVLVWHNVLPEMTHNEIVGWRTPHEDVAVLFCYSKDDFEKNRHRLAYLKKVVKQYTNTTIDIVIKGDSYWQQAVYYIHLTDWLSVYLADLCNQNAMEVKVIDGLKKEMSKK